MNLSKFHPTYITWYPKNPSKDQFLTSFKSSGEPKCVAYFALILTDGKLFEKNPSYYYHP